MSPSLAISPVAAHAGRRPLRVVAARSSRPSVKSTVGQVQVVQGKQFNRLDDAVKAGLVQGCPPFPDGIDAFGFFNDIQQTEAQRYADVEITHGRAPRRSPRSGFPRRRAGRELPVRRVHHGDPPSTTSSTSPAAATKNGSTT